MASGGKKNRDSDEEEGSVSGGALGAALAIAGGAMLGAAILYGAKKLCDMVSEQIAEVDKYSESDQPAKKIDDDDDDDMPLVGSSNPQPGSSTASKPFGEKEEEAFTSLVDGLESYEESYVRVSPDEMQEACLVLEEVKDIFMQTCAEQLKGHPIGVLVTSGSAVDGLKVVCPDEFDVTVPLEVDDNMWELVEGGATVLDATGYWLIKRKEREFYPVGSCAYDRYTVGEYLSASKIREAFQELVVEW